LRKGDSKDEAARVVCLSSVAYDRAWTEYIQHPGLENLNGTIYDAPRNYGNAKLSNMLFAHELNRRYENNTQGRRIIANSVHPGGIFTGLQGDIPLWPTYIAWSIVAPFLFKSIPQGAGTTITAAFAKTGGNMYNNCQPDEAFIKTIKGMFMEDMPQLSKAGLSGKEDNVIEEAGKLVWNKTNELLLLKGYQV